MAKLVKRELVLLKIESTYNTDANPTAANDALLVENLAWSFEGMRMVERNPITGSLARKKSLYAGALVSVTFDAELKGSGAAGTAPEIGPALRACGFAEAVVVSTSVAYSPASTGHESATIYYYEDGSLYKLTGCRGTVSGSLETGSAGKLSFTFTGHLASKSDTALPAATYDATVPAPLINVPFSIGGYSAVINALSFDVSNEIVTPANLSATDGFGEIRISGRDVNGSFDPEAQAFATKDFINELQTGASLALSCGVIGSSAGNRVQINMPAVSYRELSPGDRDGVRTYEIGFGAHESSGDDELTLLFT